MNAIEVRDLRKSYGDTLAVDGISFEVAAGEIFGMVGPNGAGKTTTIECIEGLRRPDAGHIRVAGLNPQTDGYALRTRIGVQLQESALPQRIKVWEALDLFAAFYPRSLPQESLLAQLGLQKQRNTPFARLSGGQKQRLFIALALLPDPEIVFLDELTTGLDPQARRAMWDMVRDIRQQGKTVFLTTHFMEEAERLCDRVAVIDHGRIIALDTPARLIRQLGAGHRIAFRLENGFQPDVLQGLEGVQRIETTGEEVIVYGQSEAVVSQVVNALTARQVRFCDLRTEQPTLEDVFLALTGREIRD
ncbi:MAG: ABC transporter ATP-binding protein [Caldilineae bacterium]|nr:MAG: ABC transporter ATP-binding protein [Caldilineae bacterium]